VKTKKEKHKHIPRLAEKKGETKSISSLPAGRQGLLIAAATVILIITYFSLSPSLKCEFTNWDDPRYVLENPLLKSTKPANLWQIIKTKEVSLNYHPLTIISLAFDYEKAGLEKSMHFSA